LDIVGIWLYFLVKVENEKMKYISMLFWRCTYVDLSAGYIFSKGGGKVFGENTAGE
jgi:hypothetical protein